MIIEDVPQGESQASRYGRIANFAALVLLGLVLLIFPDRGLMIGAFLLGLWLIMDGVGGLIRFFQSSITLKELNSKVLLGRSLLWIILGALFISRPGFMARMSVGSIFFFIGLIFVIQAVIIWSMTKEETPGGILLFGAIGILLMLSPIFSALWFIRLLGLSILVRGGLGLYKLFSFSK